MGRSSLEALKWEWCDACERYMLRCPNCKNNACNGGYGTVDGEVCDLCPAIYKLQDYLKAPD